MTGGQKPRVRHVLVDIVSPINVTVRCDCGWRHTETRRQNALARASKMDAAIRKHFKEVEKANGGTK